jgi:CrcB protein
VSPAVRLYIAVGLGSGFGAVARYLVSLALLGQGFPWATLTVNVVGSFLIGFYATLTEPDGRLFARPATRQFVLAGFCGGFTTFSIFSFETLRLAEAGRTALALTNVMVSVVLWLAAVWVGWKLGERLNRLKGA